MPDVFIAGDLKEKEKEEVKQMVKIKPQGHVKKDIGKTQTRSKKNEKEGLAYPKSEEEKKNLPGHTHNPLAAFCYFPDYVKFVNQDPRERVILLLRRHPITNIRWILTTLLFLIIPVFLPFLSIFEILPVAYQIIFTIAWYLMITAFVFEKFLSWYFHVNIITDERIIEVDFLHLVYREITDANIDQIQDVTVEVGSAIRTTFNYGDVIIQTAAQLPKIEFEAVPQPDRVAKVLRELRIEEEVEKLEGRVR